MASSSSASSRWSPNDASAKHSSTDSGQTRGELLHRVAANPWPKAATPVLAGISTGISAVFVALAIAAYHAAAFPLDRDVSGTVQSWRTDFFVPGVNFIGDLAGPVGAIVEYILILTVMLILRLAREAFCTAIAGFGAEALNILTNTIVARPRPPTYHGHTLFNIGSHSFPSGHTADAVGLFGFLFYLAVLAERAHPVWRGWLRAFEGFCVFYVLDTGVSRVLEGQHWPSDVFAGYLAGALMMILGIVVYHVLALRDRRVAGQQSANGAPAFER